MTVDDIVSVAIHPAIGIARVGNAPDEWYLGADVCGQAPQDPDGFRDLDGKIKRQVARFRIYATLASGALREITADEADITWRVEVANLKAGWYAFTYPLDLGVPRVAPPPQRNATLTGSSRNALNIRPRPRTIEGRNQAGTAYQFDDGRFFDTSVYLGEMRTDDVGRLLFFGGHGKSAPRIAGTKPTTFANNDEWHDDICDGPVRATVRIAGVEHDATPAHVVVAPPNYGPGLFGVVTMHDVLEDLYIAQGWISAPSTTQFTRDIWPIFDRLTGHQWVNDGIYLIAGYGSPLNARDPDIVARLNDASKPNMAYRAQVLALFRKPGENRPEALPPFYGDALSDRATDGTLLDPTRQEMLLTNTQFRHLENWAKGHFYADWQSSPEPSDFDALTPEQQTHQLDRAGMVECLGGPFHPGIEITWPFRRISMWQAPYRLRTVPEGEAVEQDYGPELPVEIALSDDGPHGVSGAGSLTRWLGVPWQTDEASCNSGLLYSPELYLSSPSFWGARVPNQILSLDAFQLATSGKLSEVQTGQHFGKRHLWLRDINANGYQERITAMVSRWWRLGLVEAKTPPPGSGLPDPTFVETGRSSIAQDDPTVDMLNAVLSLDGKDAATGLGAEVTGSFENESDDQITTEQVDRRRYKTFGRDEI